MAWYNALYQAASGPGQWKCIIIPVQLGEKEFEKFILPHLSFPHASLIAIGYHKAFNYLLKVLYTGMR